MLPAVHHLESFITRITCLCLLAQLCLGARVPGAKSEETFTELVNPLGGGEEERRLLQSYIQANLKEGQGSEVSTWEQAVFSLFRLYDFDRSGHMDGLEMMKLLSDYNSHKPPGTKTDEPIVTMVDFLLQTRDLNQDGLLAPSELLSSPLPYTQDSYHKPQEQEMVVEEKLVTSEDILKTGEGELKEIQQIREYEENIHQEEVRHAEEVPLDRVLETHEEDDKREQKELDGLQIPKALAPAEGGEGQQHGALVHQGQPEM
ncbi:Cell growth regulator with EF hand domain protein 1 [Merluccius polli]|uniref:Cell growth regulator with EF hand domain protein 1 n=1 Tax=Merluccius polli TaxID=89951 RepID=A0AA47N5G1_MERPO|nr:Cell growth regulator with EF hand domain protein 1 [Merluccius polli]